MSKLWFYLFLVLTIASMAIWLAGFFQGYGFGCTDLYSGACIAGSI